MSQGGARAREHYAHEAFEHLDFGPCGCGCGSWVEWNGGDDSWGPADAYGYMVLEPESKTKGFEVVAIVVRDLEE